MSQYLVRRILVAIPTIFGITILIFLAMRVLPGDPIAIISSETSGNFVLSPEQVAAARASLGLDKPYYVQYLQWMGDVAQGNLGTSFWTQETTALSITSVELPVATMTSPFVRSSAGSLAESFR